MRRKTTNSTKLKQTSITNSKSYRVIVKNRVSHENIPCQPKINIIEEPSKQIAVKQHINPVANIKQYVKNMKKVENNHIINIQTNRNTDIVSKKSIKTQLTITEPNIYQANKPVTIQQLEVKLSELVLKKISKFGRSHPFPQFKVTSGYNQIQKEINRLINILKQYKVERENSNQQAIELINKRIRLIQQLIAQSSTQSEMIKKFYYANRAQKVSPSLINKNNFTLYKSASILQQITASLSLKNTYHHNKRSESITMQSTKDSLAYKKLPQKQYYQEKKIKSKYIENRQPIGRSTYRCEFLEYGNLPKYNYKEENIWLTNDKLNRSKDSTYKNDYKENHNKLGKSYCYNYKQLDCYHDKFKNPKISFMKQIIKQQTKSRQIAQTQTTKINQNMTNNSIFAETQKQFLKQSFVTTNMSNFKGNHKQLISTIKDQNLVALKYSYRNYKW